MKVVKRGVWWVELDSEEKEVGRTLYRPEEKPSKPKRAKKLEK